MARQRSVRLPPRDSADLCAEVDAEIRLHVELRVRQLMERGWDEATARAEALRRFGPMESARRAMVRNARGRERRERMRERLDALVTDLLMALRMLRREPGFALVVVVTIALGMGANAAMFGIVDRLLLRGPEHVREPARVVRITQAAVHPQRGEVRNGDFGYVTYAALRDGAATVFEGAAAMAVNAAILGLGEEAESIQEGSATHDLFALLGVQPFLGRFFTAEEDAPPRGRNVMVLSHGLFQRRFGGDRAVLGRTVVLRGESYTIIGVAPPGFTGAELLPVDLWVPMSAASHSITSDWWTTWGAQWLRVFARLREDVSPERAGEAATAAYRAAYTGDDALELASRIEVAPLQSGRDGSQPLEVSVSKWLVGVAAIVLLVACANVANLHLARAARRRRDVAVRLALGVGRGRLAGMLLTETVVLAVLGTAGGLLVAHWGGGLIRAVLLPQVQWTTAPVNGRVLAFTFALMIATVVLTGLLPALRAGARDLTTALRSGPRAGGGRRSRARTTLTLVQASLSLVLLVGAGLFVRSLSNALHADLGIEPDRVVTVDMFWPRPAAAEGEGASSAVALVGARTRSGAARTRGEFFARALERVQAIPGIESAALAVGTPFHSSFGVDLRVPGYDSLPELPGGGPYVSAVTSDYFRTAGTTLLRGRAFEANEGAGTEPVTIINETMARALWPDGDPLGQCIHIGNVEDTPPCARIVGIVEEATRFGLRFRPAMQYYVPLGQERGIGGTLLLFRPQAERPPAALLEAVRRELQQLDTRGGYVQMRSLRESTAPHLRPWRLGAMLFGLFGALALVIAAVGLYSVIAFSVAERTHELGVRMALGARRGDVRAMVLRQAVAVALAGIVIGSLVALLAATRVQPLLFDASARDPFVFAVVALTLLGAAVLASVVPAVRATRVDPLDALRAE